MRILFGFALLTLGVLGASQAEASVFARIDLSSQRMFVSVNGVPTYSWAVSTARRGYRTPVGNFRPIRMHRRYYSRRYAGAAMPYSVFFYGGYAIHGTDKISQLGRPASHGCVRLHPSHAATLFNLINRHGRANSRIQVRW